MPPSSSTTADGPFPWHQALVFALLGERRPELGMQRSPDLDELDDWLRKEDRLSLVRERAAARRAVGQPWPFPLTDDLALPPAQLTASVYALRTRLQLLGSVATPAPARSLSADELRLLREVPPHHGNG